MVSEKKFKKKLRSMNQQMRHQWNTMRETNEMFHTAKEKDVYSPESAYLAHKKDYEAARYDVLQNKKVMMEIKHKHKIFAKIKR